jgi:hypothetical protein
MLKVAAEFFHHVSFPAISNSQVRGVLQRNILVLNGTFIAL